MKQIKSKESKIMRVAHCNALYCVNYITILTEAQSQNILMERLVQSFEAVEHCGWCHIQCTEDQSFSKLWNSGH